MKSLSLNIHFVELNEEGNRKDYWTYIDNIMDLERFMNKHRGCIVLEIEQL